MLSKKKKKKRINPYPCKSQRLENRGPSNTVTETRGFKKVENHCPTTSPYSFSRA